MRKYIISLYLFSFIILSFLNANKIVIQNFNERFGLPKNMVNCMCMFQDSKGFLWFGMANGLYKFDLNSFTYFSLQKNKIYGFPESDIRAIIEYAPGQLLIGTYNKGLQIYNTITEKSGTIHCTNSPVDFSKLFIHTLYLDKTGAVWVGTFNGLFKIKYSGDPLEKFEFLERFDKSNTKLVAEEFVGIMESDNNALWLLTTSDIAHYNNITKRINAYATYDSNSSFIFADNKRILIGCFGAGIKIFNTETFKFESVHIKGLTDNSQIRYVHKDKQSNIWLSISNVGLMLLESEITNPRITLVSNKDREYSSLNSNVIYHIGESDDGALWVCSEDGVNMIYLNKIFFNSYTCINSENNSTAAYGIRALLNAGNDIFWTGTVGGGLKQFNNVNKKYTDVPLVNNNRIKIKNVQAIIKDFRGNIWLGTEGDGVIKFTPDRKAGVQKGTVINYKKYNNTFPENTILNDYIMCLLEDRHKNIWIGTWHGLSLLDSTEVVKKDQSKAEIKNFLHDSNDKHSISNNTVMSLLEDKDGIIWVGTQEGINKVVKTNDGYKFEHTFRNNSGTLLTEKKVLVMYQSKKGDLWFSTQDGGICLLDDKNDIFYERNSGNGFHDYSVNSIVEDGSENLWLGTNNGLCRFNPATGSFHTYTTEDGLVSDIFLFASGYKDKELLYFGETLGLTVFNPDNFVSSTFLPNLVFTDFRLFNKPVIVGSKDSPIKQHISRVQSLTLNYNQNYVTLAFSALNYKQHQEIRYSCIMEGFESSWNNLGKDHKITYNNLAPGNYLFKAKAYSSNDYKTSSEISLQIIVKPPFWKTTWAYLIYISLFVYTLIQIYIFFLNKEKRKNALTLERISAKRVHEMDMMKLQFFTNISHEFRTPLTLMYAPLETLMKANPDPSKAQTYYQMMFRNVQRLKRLIDQLLDLRKIEEGYMVMEWNHGDIIEFIQRTFNTFQYYSEKRNINFTFQTGISVKECFFDADKLDKVLFNLFSNAFKYTPDYGTISLKIILKASSGLPFNTQADQYIEIQLADSGFGIPKESLDKIFHPFQQVDSNKPIDSAATGIGLSLTRELIELHKGYITVKSEVNKGSTFTVYIPVYESTPQTGGQIIQNKLKGDDRLDENILIEEQTEAGINQEVKLPPSRPLILIVEDSPDLRTFLKNELENDYRLIETTNGEEGLEQAVGRIPDLVLSDIMMDKMDGIELCKKLKTDERTSHIPVILLTARYSDEVKLNSYELGADDYITKPFNIGLLKSRLKNLIEQRRLLRKLFGKGNNFDYSEIATNKIDSQFLEKLNLVIEKNIANPDFDPTMLASEMAMSRMQLYRKVTALTNQTVYNFIRTIRLNKAAQLLVTSDMQVAEIAIHVGYTEPSNFTKCFTRQFNQTPSQFAKDKRNL